MVAGCEEKAEKNVMRCGRMKLELCRPELAAFFLALRGTPVKKLMIYLCDSPALLKALKRWIGKGGKATLV